MKLWQFLYNIESQTVRYKSLNRPTKSYFFLIKSFVNFNVRHLEQVILEILCFLPVIIPAGTRTFVSQYTN
jgi:hypothetical protein